MTTDPRDGGNLVPMKMNKQPARQTAAGGLLFPPEPARPSVSEGLRGTVCPTNWKAFLPRKVLCKYE